MNAILIVDDDSDSREMLAKFFVRAGFNVRTAPNGRQALIAVATAVPDVVILDVMMPEMNGIEFLAVIRSYLRWSDIPVILLTAYDKGRHTEVAHEYGVRHTFLKADFDLADLLACVNRLRENPKADC